LRSLLMMVKLAASVVWSIKASRSTLAQAKNIYRCISIKRNFSSPCTHCDYGLDRHVVFLQYRVSKGQTFGLRVPYWFAR
jgi:hypothetical protein